MARLAPKKKVITSKKINKPPLPSSLVENEPSSNESSPTRTAPKSRRTSRASFMEDWQNLRRRHRGQLAVIEAFFGQNKKYIFNRTGRKGAKTTTAIDIAWRFGMENPNSIIYICCPTITQAKEIYWDEGRLQKCDIKDDYMYDKYVKEYSKSQASITLVSGSMIKLVGTWTEARGRGTQPDLLIYDEVQDCDPLYMDAADSNLAAKPNARCMMQGTPSKKLGHYQAWEKRIDVNPEGAIFHFPSYINTALPHLKKWLDNKRDELIAAGLEDQWLREYMAQDCFSSEDRILPDIEIVDFDQTLRELKSFQSSKIKPNVSMVVSKEGISYSVGAYLHSRERGIQSWILENGVIKDVWNKGHVQVYEEIQEKTNFYKKNGIFISDFDFIAADETKSLSDVLPSINIVGKGDVKESGKWNERGTQLLKEMVKSKNICYTNKAAEIAPECQNFLKGDNIFEFPHICSSTLFSNEFYRAPNLNKQEKKEWDDLKALRDAGIVCAPSSQKRESLCKYNF